MHLLHQIHSFNRNQAIASIILLCCYLCVARSGPRLKQVKQIFRPCDRRSSFRSAQRSYSVEFFWAFNFYSVVKKCDECAWRSLRHFSDFALHTFLARGIGGPSRLRISLQTEQLGVSNQNQNQISHILSCRTINESYYHFLFFFQFVIETFWLFCSSKKVVSECQRNSSARNCETI